MEIKRIPVVAFLQYFVEKKNCSNLIAPNCIPVVESGARYCYGYIL